MPLPFTATDTIVAISTPPQSAALGIVRLSGAAALSFPAHFFVPATAPLATTAPPFSPTARGAWRGKIVVPLPKKKFAIPAVVYQMPAPRSFTGEDVVEFILPGSLAVLQMVHQIFCPPAPLAGISPATTAPSARPARAGEFAWRAFTHGRLTLPAAAALADLLAATDAASRREAVSVLRNGATKELTTWREELREISALIAAELDFSDTETPAEFFTTLAARLAVLHAQTQRYWQRAANRRAGDKYLPVGLIGLTNVGKSSLFNRLLGTAAALTAPETSTTRDLLTGVWALDSLRVALSDGPGEDFSATPLAEKLRGRNAATRPNFALLLLVLDGTAAPDAALARFVRELPPPPLVVIFNKSDLPSAPELEATVKAWLAAAEKKVLAFCQVSAATGAGIDELKTVVSDFARRDVPAGGGRDEVEINAWRGALTAVAQARPQIAAGELALAAFELREADEALRELTGENYAEEILTRVFARFCLGK